MNDNEQRPEWLDEFEELANDRLDDNDDGSACRQVHPIIERWYTQLMASPMPMSRDSILQAIACLSTEILLDIPAGLFENVSSDKEVQDDLAYWIQSVLMVGRAFQLALDNGELDDL